MANIDNTSDSSCSGFEFRLFDIYRRFVHVAKNDPTKLSCFKNGNIPDQLCGDMIRETHILEQSEQRKKFLISFLQRNASFIALHAENPPAMWDKLIEYTNNYIKKVDSYISNVTNGGKHNFDVRNVSYKLCKDIAESIFQDKANKSHILQIYKYLKYDINNPKKEVDNSTKGSKQRAKTLNALTQTNMDENGEKARKYSKKVEAADDGQTSQPKIIVRIAKSALKSLSPNETKSQHCIKDGSTLLQSKIEDQNSVQTKSAHSILEVDESVAKNNITDANNKKRSKKMFLEEEYLTDLQNSTLKSCSEVRCEPACFNNQPPLEPSNCCENNVIASPSHSESLKRKRHHHKSDKHKNSKDHKKSKKHHRESKVEDNVTAANIETQLLKPNDKNEATTSGYLYDDKIESFQGVPINEVLNCNDNYSFQEHEHYDNINASSNYCKQNHAENPSLNLICILTGNNSYFNKYDQNSYSKLQHSNVDYTRCSQKIEQENYSTVLSKLDEILPFFALQKELSFQEDFLSLRRIRDNLNIRVLKELNGSSII